MPRPVVLRAIKRNREKIRASELNETPEAPNCAKCGAPAGSACKDSLGRKMSRAHAGRA